MTKYDLYTERFEFRTERGLEWTTQDIIDAYDREGNRFPTLIAQADTLEEIIPLFEKESRGARTDEVQGYCNRVFLTGEMYWVEENEYDDDGEFDQGGGWIKYRVIPYTKEEN